MNAAAIDLGTNSIKILIVKRDSDGHMQVLFRHRSVVRLGEGSFEKKGKGRIPRYVQVRTLKVFQTYAKFLEAYKVDVVRAIGTSALREAENGPDFVDEVRVKTGIALEILPGEEEARLIVKGVASEYPLPKAPVLFVDIGGGSCEISLVKNKKIEKFVSLPLGAVRLTELFLAQKKSSRTDIKRLDTHIKKILKENWPQPPKVKLALGSAGTIRALARLVNKTELTEDERLIKKRQLERVNVRIDKLSKKRIAALPGVDAKRAEILQAGAHALKGVFDWFGINEIKVSNRGLREGLLVDLFERPQKPATFHIQNSDKEKAEFYDKFARKFHSDRAHCYHVWTLCNLLFDELVPVHAVSAEFKPLLMAAALMHDVGRYIEQEGNHKHTFYILNNAKFPFFKDRQQLFVATLARYHKKSPPRSDHEGFSSLPRDDQQVLEKLAAILRIAEGLDRHHDQSVKWLKCQWGPGKVRIGIEMKNAAALNPNQFKDCVELFEQLYKVSVAIVPMNELTVAKTPQLESRVPRAN